MREHQDVPLALAGPRGVRAGQRPMVRPPVRGCATRLRSVKLSENQRVFKFGRDAQGNDVTEGDKSMAAVLGGKGCNLAEMARIGLPVPPGFTISCQTCMDYYHNGN